MVSATLMSVNATVIRKKHVLLDECKWRPLPGTTAPAQVLPGVSELCSSLGMSVPSVDAALRLGVAERHLGPLQAMLLGLTNTAAVAAADAAADTTAKAADTAAAAAKAAATAAKAADTPEALGPKSAAPPVSQRRSSLPGRWTPSSCRSSRVRRPGILARRSAACGPTFRMPTCHVRCRAASSGRNRRLNG